MTEQAGDYLIEQMNSMGGKPTDYSDEVFGKVQSVDPLTIWISQNIQIGSQFLELTTEAKGLSVNITLPVSKDNQDNGVASGTITIFPPLQVGERVRMLRVQKGQRFIVLGRA